MLGEVTAIIIDLVFLLLNFSAFQIKSISYKHITHRFTSVGSRHLVKTHQVGQNRTTGIRHYNPPINFRARSLDKTHLMIQNQTTGIRQYTPSDFNIRRPIYKISQFLRSFAFWPTVHFSDNFQPRALSSSILINYHDQHIFYQKLRRHYQCMCR